MKRIAVHVIVVLIVHTLAMATGADDTAESVKPEAEPFPIVTRFDITRDYGYFIGDEIPLTLVVETAKGVVLDLVNLPHRGEQHGLFEVRDFALTSTASKDGGTVYRVAYRLQYFGAAPLTIQFEPLEILYAAADAGVSTTPVPNYKSLFTQPVAINISRIGPYEPTKALDPKGPLPDKRAEFVWLPCLLGVTLLTVALGGWGKAWAHRQRQHRIPELTQPTMAAQTLQALRQPVGPFGFLHKEEAPAASTYLGHVLRQYVQAEWGVPAFALTPAELSSRLQGTPQAKSLLNILQQCDTLKYQQTQTDEAEERFLWEETVALFEQLETRSTS
jgi:hypothetical protein